MTTVATIIKKTGEPKAFGVPKPEEERSAANVEAEIRTRAYQIYEQRGRIDGHHLDDWLQAVSEIIRRRNAA